MTRLNVVMPFGLDDILLLVASASPVLWAKRGDVVRSAVHKTVTFARNNGERAPLAGVDVEGASKADDVRSTLVSSSIVGKFAGEALHDHPCGLRRHFNRPRPRRPHVSELQNYSVEKVAASVGGYSIAEVCRLYELMEEEGRWEAALTVTEGARSGSHHAYLIKKNVEATVRTLLLTGEMQRAVDCCLTYAKEVLLSDDVLVALFDACRDSEKKSLALYHTLKPFHAEWSPAIYACCLTVNARFNWQEALLLYNEYMEMDKQSGLSRIMTNIMKGVGLNNETEEIDSTDASLKRQPLQFLYHIILPLVADRQVERLQECYKHMLAHDPESAVDVLLRCLHTERGRELAADWLQEPFTSAPSLLSSSESVIHLATRLYGKKPNAMNMNSLLKVIMAQTPETLEERLARKLQEHLCLLAMTENDACVLTRTVTGQSGQWRLASHFMASLVTRKQYGVLPSLSFYVAQQGRWALASQAMAVYLANRGCFTQVELCLCVESSVFAGRWKSAFFWMERAHACGVRLPVSVYDNVLALSRHCLWSAALRAVTSMHEAGGLASEKGILDVLEATATQGEVDKALRVISATGNVYWTL